MAPHVHIVAPHEWFDGPPLPYMEQVLYGPPYVQPDGPPLPYVEQVLYGPPDMYVWSPHIYDMIFSGQLQKSPLCVLISVVISHLVPVMTMKEVQQAAEIWKQAHLSTVISNKNIASSLDVPMHDLKQEQGKVQLTTKIVILIFQMIMVRCKVKLNMHSKCFKWFTDISVAG